MMARFFDIDVPPVTDSYDADFDPARLPEAAQAEQRVIDVAAELVDWRTGRRCYRCNAQVGIDDEGHWVEATVVVFDDYSGVEVLCEGCSIRVNPDEILCAGCLTSVMPNPASSHYVPPRV